MAVSLDDRRHATFEAGHIRDACVSCHASSIRLTLRMCGSASCTVQEICRKRFSADKWRELPKAASVRLFGCWRETAGRARFPSIGIHHYLEFVSAEMSASACTRVYLSLQSRYLHVWLSTNMRLGAGILVIKRGSLMSLKMQIRWLGRFFESIEFSTSQKQCYQKPVPPDLRTSSPPVDAQQTCQ